MRFSQRLRIIIGWITAIISLLIIGFWSYWGVNEAFYEGWYHTSILRNISLTFVQYLLIPTVFLAVTSIAMSYKRIGSALFVVLAIFSMFFFKSNSGRMLILIPLLLFASGFYFGDFKNKKIIIYLSFALFLLIILSFGIPQLIRVEKRFNDNNFGSRIIEGNDIALTWAPQGVGFPLDGTDWQTAKDNCARLDEEGTKLENNEINAWRLPSRDEIIRSMTHGDENAGGYMDSSGAAQYIVKPDKETPLWNPHSQVIYYWTSEQKDEKRAYLVAYNGYILSRIKDSGPDYQGYRCVKETLDTQGIYRSNIGSSCKEHSDCKLPIEYAVQSNCPFGTACINSRCKVVCPLAYHDPDEERSISYYFSCETDYDCDCSEREGRTIACVCVDNRCVSVEDE